MNNKLLATTGLLLCTVLSTALPTMAEDAPRTVPESLSRLSKVPLAQRQLNIQSWQTEQGSRVLFVAAPELPMFDLRLTFAAGSSRDQGVPGLAMLTNAMLNEGIPGQDVTAIAQGFEDLGAQFSNGAYRDMAVLSLRSLTAPQLRNPALTLFAQVAGQPTFPTSALKRLRNQLLAGFEHRKQNPGKLASIRLFQTLYGQHPYAHPSDGLPESLPTITKAQLKAFHQRAYAAGNAVIALVGDLTRSDAEQIAAQISAALPSGPALPPLPAPEPPKPGQQHIDYASQQTHLMLAQLGVTRGHPDYPALYVGNQLLGGGGLGSLLMEEVREKRGLTYGIYSQFMPMAARGPFTIQLQTRADQAEATLNLVRQLVRTFIQQGVSQAELERAKREISGRFPLNNASNANIVGLLSNIGFYDLPLDYPGRFLAEIESLTAEQVMAAVRHHLSEEAFVVISVGPSDVPQQPLPPPTQQRATPSARVPH